MLTRKESYTSAGKTKAAKDSASSLRISDPNDVYEREADRVAEAVIRGRRAPAWSISKMRVRNVQRQTPQDQPAPKPNNYDEAAKKLGEAFLKTDVGKKLTDAAKDDPLVKAAEDFVGTLPGKIIAGAAATGAVSAMAATHTALPAQIPEIPLDKIRPGLSVKITYEGPVDRPTKAMITFGYTPKGEDKKPKQTESERYRAETARMAAEQEKFRAGITYKPGSPEDLQQKAEQKAIEDWNLKRFGALPGTGGRPLVPNYPALQEQRDTGLPLPTFRSPFQPKAPAAFDQKLELKPLSAAVPLPDAEKKKEEQAPVQRKAASGAPMRAEATDVEEVLRSPGRPLDESIRRPMESKIGFDLGKVRIHTDEEAAASAKNMNALAYTVGKDVVFGKDRYSPQTEEGRKLLAHELTHTVQQRDAAAEKSPLALGSREGFLEREAREASQQILNGRTVGRLSSAGLQVARQPVNADDLINPYLDEEPAPGKAEAEEFRRATISVVRDPILEALKRSDAIDFLNRLRALGPEDRSQLEGDAAFLDEIHRALHGMAFWIVLLILRFGNSKPLYVRQLSLAVSQRNIQQIKDLLRTYSELRDPTRVPGVREMLDYEFRADREHNALLALMDAPEVGGRSSITATFKEAHYERPAGGGAYQLQSFTGTTDFSLARTGSELRVLVRIHLVEATNVSQTFYPDDRTANEWRTGIERVWNNHFVATNGTTRLRVIFVPLFTEDMPNQTVQIDHGQGRSDEHKWFLQSVSGDVIAHEFGHMVGNPDEYRLPGKTSDIPAGMGLSPAEAQRSSVQGITGTAKPTKAGGYTMPGIMGEEYGQVAQPRHVGPVMDLFNQTMLRLLEMPFHLE